MSLNFRKYQPGNDLSWLFQETKGDKLDLHEYVPTNVYTHNTTTTRRFIDHDFPDKGSVIGVVYNEVKTISRRFH